MQLRERVDKLKEDLDNRIEQEYQYIKNEANPREEINEYFKNIRWDSPELAAYVKKKMLDILNLND